ncbi:M14 family metallopeptidase [Halalkalibacter alkaliphilus]|uniref:M14 family metallopeptidase n=1 Tax=Halalkalibacter alkaliphilus TaxID=2917993 RepID=A0A9X2CRQ7_9BACI|nr:M14 family zinc carboxypeptidase [Halalkalibacter alkaliphilus]MCL7746834.1 M14 family metallopeptidase [Halalkalibacter alkaliphilus]
MRKFITVLAALIMLLSVVAPTSLPVMGSSSVEASEAIELEVSRSLFSLTEARTVEVQADFGEDVDVSKLEWTFGGKSLSEWKKWSGGTDFDGEPFITVIEEPHFVDDTTVVKATLEFGLLFDRTNLSNRTIRVQYQQFIGDYELALIDSESGAKAATEVKLNVYDEFLFYDELKPAIDQVFEEAAAKNDRYLEYQNVGTSVEGRDIHFVILARDQEAVDKYLNETLPTALENPDYLLEKLHNGTMGDYQVPVWFNNIHPDEVEGVDAQVELFKKFALEDEVTFTMDEQPVTLTVDDVLDDVIFLYMFTNNPDGRVANTRANANGFDLNRDNAYQTQVETQQVNELISKWTPLSFLDMHGYVNGFLIEPATPPHNPNFEYDLLVNSMLDQAHAMGQAGVGHSQLSSYFIPKLDWESGWDDMTPAYTAIYAMLHGSLGHTIEVPELSQDSLYAMVGTGLGATSYVTENKDELYAKQLEIFKRGVDGEDNRAVDEHFVNAAGESIGRVRGEHDNFFPDYYVIPTDEKEQKNNLEAHKMVDYLLRNGVKVEQTTKNLQVDGTMYPKGTYVVPMNQAKRGLANAVLYSGDNVSDWGAMYDPIVVNFPALRGFDIHEIREAGAFSSDVIEVESVTIPTSSVSGNTPKQVLKNTNNDTIKLVNDLLKDGKAVEVALESDARVNKGDFIVATKDLRAYENTYYFEMLPLGNGQNIKTNKLTKPEVAVTGSAQLRFTLDQLGFNLVDQAEADVIVSDGASFNEEQVDGKTFIGIGRPALNAVRNSGLFPGFSVGSTSGIHEGLVKANVNDHLLTSGYQEEELLYVTTGSWIESVPEGADVLVTFSESDDFYVSGWWPGHEEAKGQTLAFTKDLENTTFTLFANSLAFRAHTEHSYRLLANSIYASVGSEVEQKRNVKGKAKGQDIEVATDKVKVERTKDENGNNKVNAKITEGAFVDAVAFNDRVDRLTVEVDGDVSDKVIEVQLLSSEIEQLKQAHADARLTIDTEKGTYTLPLADFELEKVAKNNGQDVTISIQIEVEEETYNEGREVDSDERALENSQVTVFALVGNAKVEILSYKVLVE